MKVNPAAAGMNRAEIRSCLERMASIAKANLLTHTMIADKLHWEIDVVDAALSGEVDLTLNELADLAWACDLEVILDIQPAPAP